MNSRERVRLSLTCNEPDRVPRALGFFSQSIPDIHPTEPEDYFDLDVRFVTFEQPTDHVAFLRYLSGLPKDTYVGNLPQLRTYDLWGYHPELGPEGPLTEAQTLAELAEYNLPRSTCAAQYRSLAAQVQAWHRKGLAVAGSSPHLGGQLFETAWRLRGFDSFLIDMVQRKELANYLLDQVAALLLENSLLLARAGVDILLLDDDVAMPTGLLMSPDTWREFFRPRLVRVIEAARRIAPELLVFYHSDGDFTALVPDLIGIGVNVINPVQPDCMDAAALKRDFGDRLALWGTVGTAEQWDSGTPDALRDETKRRLASLADGGGLLIAPAYDVDFAPFENIVAFFEAIDACG